MHSFILLFIHSFIHSIIHSFILHSFIYFIHSFFHSFIHLFAHSFIHSLILFQNYIMEDVLELLPSHMPALIGYIVAEAMAHPGCDDNTENVCLHAIGRRKKLYVVSCYSKPDCAQMVVDYLLEKLKVDR